MKDQSGSISLHDFDDYRQYNPTQQQFVLNKRCKKCGSKLYWVKANRKYICQECKDKTEINIPPTLMDE